MIAGAAVGASAPNVGAYIGSRVILGVGTATGREFVSWAYLDLALAFCLPCATLTFASLELAATALVPELSHPRIRHFAGSYLLTCFYVSHYQFPAWTLS